MEKLKFINYLETRTYSDNRKYADSTIRNYSIKLETIEENFNINLDKEYKENKCYYIIARIDLLIKNKRNGRCIGIYGPSGHEWGLSSLKDCRSAIKAYIDFKDNEDKNYNYSYSNYNKKYIEKDLINKFLKHFNISKQEFLEWIITELQDDIFENIIQLIK